MLGMAYPPCQLTEATELGVLESSGVGLPAIRARRLPAGRVPDTTALLGPALPLKRRRAVMSFCA